MAFPFRVKSVKGGNLGKWSKDAHHAATTTVTTQHSVPVAARLLAAQVRWDQL
jgi:hypothetical protein